MNDNYTTLSNNIFDEKIFSKKEISEMIENLITTINLLVVTDEINTELSSKTIKLLLEFGIIQDNNVEVLRNNIGDDLLRSLIVSINKLRDKNIEELIDLRKYHTKIRHKMVAEEYKSEKPTLVDLFCGAGGLSLGLSQAGFRIIFANDIEKSALRTYSFNHPEVSGESITLGGIENIAHNIHEYVKEDVDVLAGGPPCQGFSTANRQRVMDDPRNILYRYYVESVWNLKPKIFVMENVKGMLKVADQVVEDFNGNPSVGYNIGYRVLNAKNMGVPQNRERLIYIGIRNDLSENWNISPIEVLNAIEKEGMSSKVNLIEAIEDLKTVKASRIKNFTKGDEISGFIIDKNNLRKKSKYIYEINQNKEVMLAFNHKARFNNDRDIEIFDRMLPGDKSDSPRISDIMPYKSRSHMFKDKYYKLLPSVPCKTITAHMKFDCNMYIHPFQARGLTPREAARVQSFPDDYFFLGAYTKTYQQVGNSVPPLMAKHIGRTIIKYL